MPATKQERKTVLNSLLDRFEPNASADRIAHLALLTEAWQYSRAEWIIALLECPRSTKASHFYDNGLHPADIDSVVQRFREDRRTLRRSRSITAEERTRLTREYPEVKPEHFHKCSFKRAENGPPVPVYTYSPKATRQREERRRRARAKGRADPIERGMDPEPSDEIENKPPPGIINGQRKNRPRHREEIEARRLDSILATAEEKSEEAIEEGSSDD